MEFAPSSYLVRIAESVERIRSLGFVFPAILGIWLICSPAGGRAQTQPADEPNQLAHQVIEHWPQGQPAKPGEPVAWNYELGTLLEGMDALWYDTADASYYRYVKQCVDNLLSPDGTIPTYRLQENSLDNILAWTAASSLV